MPLYWPVKPSTNPFGPQPPTRMAPYVPFGHNDDRAHQGNRMHRTATRAAATHKQETHLAHP